MSYEHCIDWKSALKLSSWPMIDVRRTALPRPHSLASAAPCCTARHARAQLMTWKKTHYYGRQWTLNPGPWPWHNLWPSIPDELGSWPMHRRKLEFERQLVQKTVETNGRTDATKCLSSVITKPLNHRRQKQSILQSVMMFVVAGRDVFPVSVWRCWVRVTFSS